MNLPTELRGIRKWGFFSKTVSVTATSTGIVVLLGWWLGIKELTSVFPGLATMKPITALCFVLAGFSLWLLQLANGEASSLAVRRIYLARALSGSMAAMGLITITEYLFRANLGIDGIAFHGTLQAAGGLNPGRMSGATALGFLFLGASMILLSARKPYPAQGLAMLASLNGFVACMGYLLSARRLYDIPAYSSMAVHTAILFVALGIAILAARPRIGIMTAIVSDCMGGMMARRVLPLAVVVPILFGWLRWRGQAVGLYGTEFGIALRTVAEVVTFFTLVFIIAVWMNKVDRDRREDQRRNYDLAAIVASSNDAMISLDPSSAIVRWNRGAEDLFGYRTDEVLGRPIATIIPHEVQEEAGRLLDKVRFGQVGAYDQTVLRRKDGGIVHVSLIISPVRDFEGRIVGSSAIVKDISERKRAEEVRERLAAVVESSDDAIVGKDLEGTITAWNSGAEKLFGYASSEAIGRPILMLLPPDRISEEEDILRRIRLGESVKHFETVRVRKDGAPIDVSVSISPIKNATGEIVGASKIARDVTERKRAERLLKQSQQDYRMLFDSMDEGFCTIEVLFDDNHSAVDFRFLEVNPAFEKQTGIPNGRGKRVRDIIPQLETYWFEIYGKIASTGEPARFENFAAQLSRWYDVHAFRFGEPEERKVAIFFDDITERKRADEALQRSEEQFRTMVNVIPQLVWMANPDGWIFWYNQGWYDYTGTTPTQMEGWGWQSVHDPTELPKVMERWRTSIATGAPFEMTFPLRSSSGEFRAFLTRVAPIKDSSGKVLRWFGTNTDVDEGRRAEKALRESEARLNEAQHTAHIGSWCYYPDGRIVGSDELYELYKVPRDISLTYDALLGAMHPDDKNRSHTAFLNQLKSGGDDFQDEYRVVWPDGQVRSLFSQSRIRRDQDGRVMEVVGTVQDVTGRKQAEETLREYRRVVEGLEEMILVVDRQYRYVIANPAFLNFRGFSSEQVVGRTVKEVVGKDTFEARVKDKMDECFCGKVVQYEMTYDFPTNGKRELSVSYFPIEGQHGIDRIACVLQDITERKLAEQALRRSEERFSKAFRSNPLAISISNEEDGRYLDVNDAFLSLLGHHRKDVIGRTAEEVHFWNEPSDRTEMLRQLKEGERVARHHTRYRTAKGALREAEVWAESIEVDGQSCILGITRDITEIKQLEAQFRQAQKMEAVGRLAGGVAHDFNNVLGVIMGYSDITLGEIGPTHPVHSHVSRIKNAAGRAAMLTQQLLAFSRKQVVFPKIVNLNAVVQNATKMFLPLVGEDVTIEFRPTIPLASIRADTGQIEQILANLVVNARDAMPNGGKVVIETSHAEIDETYVAGHVDSQAGEQVVLAVSDTGCGMDEITKSQIFEPFFTTKEVGKGTGLGLSTVYGIVKQSGGYITVYSEAGKGTTFKIYFPKVREKGDDTLLPVENAELPEGSATVLVVEDEKHLREVTVTMLRQAGYTVLEANNPEEALRVIANAELTIDLLLTDVIMPGKSGAEFAREAKERHPELRLLFMSGYTSDLVERQGVVMDEKSFLEKPFTKKSLLMKVHSILLG